VGLALCRNLGDVCGLVVCRPVWNHLAVRAPDFAVDLLENLLEKKGNARPELIWNHLFQFLVGLSTFVYTFVSYRPMGHISLFFTAKNTQFTLKL
jgi:hypothetical protein